MPCQIPSFHLGMELGNKISFFAIYLANDKSINNISIALNAA